MTKSQHIISIFKQQHGFAKTKDILKAGFTFYQLKQLEKEGKVEKVKRGLYQLRTEDIPDERTSITHIVPEGILCLYSAWEYHDLCGIVPAKYHVAIEKSKKIQLPVYPPIQLYYWSSSNVKLGLIEVEIENMAVKIYDKEKSVCDAVKFRNKIGKDTEKEVIKNYINSKDRNFDRLFHYARELRVEKILTNYLELLL